MHSTRWITGLIAAPFLILIIVTENIWYFSAFIAVATVVALWEYQRMITQPSRKGKNRVFTIVSYLTGVILVVSAGAASLEMMAFVAFAGLIGYGIVAVFQFKGDPDMPGIIAGQILGVVYIVWPLGMIVLMRGGDMGCFWVLALLGIIFSGDTAAFYTGTYFGKHKLCPSVSPKKTIEGALGGLAANALVGSLLKLFFLPAVGFGPMLLLCVVVGAVGQVGDLFESVLKRSIGIKDSGNILPGHGGILDRIDAVLFAAPVVWIFTRVIV